MFALQWVCACEGCRILWTKSLWDCWTACETLLRIYIMSRMGNFSPTFRGWESEMPVHFTLFLQMCRSEKIGKLMTSPAFHFLFIPFRHHHPWMCLFLTAGIFHRNQELCAFWPQESGPTFSLKACSCMKIFCLILLPSLLEIVVPACNRWANNKIISWCNDNWNRQPAFTSFASLYGTSKWISQC